MKKFSLICLALTCAFVMTSAAFSAAAASSNITYIRGDYNKDGFVTIGDVTGIQRVIAGIESDSDGTVKKRFDIDGNNVLDINDACAIQRYLALFDDPYGIGEKVTENVQHPTDEYELPFIPN